MSVQRGRLSDSELKTLFDRMFPHGFSGADVLSDIAPDGWERSPLFACFHPSVERVFEEQVQMHRNLEALRRYRSPARGGGLDASALHNPDPPPTLEEVRLSYQPQAVRPEEEVVDLIGLCLWDIFSDNHEVIAADGRLAHIGSFRAASAFLDGYSRREVRVSWSMADSMRFYMGTIWIDGRADLGHVYVMIFRRLRSLGADWVYHFPELKIVELGTPQPDEARGDAQLRAEVADVNTRAREDAMDHPAPSTVRAYRQVYGRDPRGWPPA